MFLALALTLFALQVSAQQTTEWIAAEGTGCRIWNPYPDPGESVTWSGGCRNGLAQGRGSLQWSKNGKKIDRFEGEFLDGKRNGQGIYSSRNGYRYEGAYRNDQRNGFGVVTYDSGARFEGQWRDNKANGQGTYKAANGQTFSGMWTNGCFRQGDRRANVGSTAKDCGFE